MMPISFMMVILGGITISLATAIPKTSPPMREQDIFPCNCIFVVNKWNSVRADRIASYDCCYLAGGRWNSATCPLNYRNPQEVRRFSKCCEKNGGLGCI
ncbi:uncharacterized protein BDZ83DRAFT_191192 [Colletotrichum acutatum]|uniref:Uncharacterized protein n=1 Tax=Glomerella acutata TaxID=27357 RepID=A0AAD8XBG9_GLOAC|nr:uncharacterized protein BDZ83DRAFT_191192 [Colletotrichum acutatum]KAK1706610.1 hypothetical protein BDZ83DRAFT_191192 [Colletotrichum acutatum]